MIPLHYYIKEPDKVKIVKAINGRYLVYYDKIRVGYIVVSYSTGELIFVKEVNLKRYRGLGQYFIYKHQVATARDVIFYLEKKYLDRLKWYVVKFVEDSKPILYVIYDWEYYRDHRKLIQEGYEPQYSIDLPESWNIILQEAKEKNKIGIIKVNKDGKMEEDFVYYFNL